MQKLKSFFEKNAFATKMIQTAAIVLLSAVLIYFIVEVIIIPAWGDEEVTDENENAMPSDGGKEDDNTSIPVSPANKVLSGTPKNPLFKVTLTVGGEEKTLLTRAKTVGELLSKEQIVLSESDELSPSSETELFDGASVTVDRITYHYETVTAKTPYSTEIREVDTIQKGTVVTIQQGQKGVVAETYRTKVINGNPGDQKELVSSDVIAKPVKCVKEKGVGGTYTAPDGTVYEYSYRLEVIATAYYDAYNRGMTATGHATVPGVVAVDKDVIPLHSKIYAIGNVGDFNVLQCEDVGNFRGNRIDIYFETIEECYRFGRRKMDVYVLEVNTCGTRVHDKTKTADLSYPGVKWND